MGRGLANTLVLLCVLVLAGSAWSAPLVFVADEFPPFSFKEGGEVRGVNTDIIRAVFHELGQSVRFEILPTKRAMYMAEAGKCAGVYTLTRSPERERVLLFSTPICKVTDVFFKRKGDSIKWETLDDLSRYCIGATVHYNYPRNFLSAAKRGVFRVDWVGADFPERIHMKKLLLGRVDLVICEIHVGNYSLMKDPEFAEGIEPIERPIGPPRGFHVGFSRAWPGVEALKDRFDATYMKLFSDGTVAGILERYGMQLPAAGYVVYPH